MVALLDQAKDFVTSIIPNVQSNFEEDGFIHPISFIGAQVNPETLKPFDPIGIVMITPTLLGVSMNDSDDTKLYTERLRMISKMCKAIMVVTVMEAWVLKLPKGDDYDRKKFPKSLEHAPGREECIQIMMEHHKLSGKVMMWGATITRDEQERGILAEFTGPDTIDGSGRFLGMVEAPS